MKKTTIILGFCALLISFLYPAHLFAYSYGSRGKDTLVAVFENIQEFAAKKDYEGIRAEIRKIEVPLTNYHNYYGLDVKPALLQAVKKKAPDRIVKGMEELIYFAIREKIYWNKKEKLKKFVASRARVRVIYQYYNVLKSKILLFDKRNGTKYNREIAGLLIRMKKSLGSPGAFGYKSQPPDFKEFISSGHRLEKLLVVIFPHFEAGYKAIITTH